MSGADQVWAMVSGLPPGKREARQFMVIQAWVDDSGSEPSSKFFVLGGFISTAEQWAKFSVEWQAALDLPPRLGYFKMSEAGSLTGEFSRQRGWSAAKRDDRVVTLARIIVKHASIRISASLEYVNFDQHLRTMPAPERKGMTDNPYMMLFTNLIMAVTMDMANMGIAEPCDFFFDEQGRMGQEAADWWPNLKTILGRSSRAWLLKLIGSRPVFRDEKTFLPLQAADLYAWQVRRRQTETAVLWVPPRPVLQMFEGMPAINRHFSEAGIRPHSK